MLVAVALSKAVMVPELAKFTIPAALLVIPVIAPEPPKLRVPVFVKLAVAVEVAPEPVMFIVPELSNVLTEIVPLLLNVPALTKIPAPPSDELIAKVPLLVNSVADEVLLTEIVAVPLVNVFPLATATVPAPVGAIVKAIVFVNPVLSMVSAPDPFNTIVPLPVLDSVIVPPV